MADFLPRRDGALVEWTANFAHRIVADPARFGLTGAQVTAYAAEQATFAGAYRAAVEPETRGLRTVLVKDEARERVIAMTRELARWVRVQPGVTVEDLLALGLRKAGGEAAGAVDENGDRQDAQRGPRVKASASGRRVTVEVRMRKGGLARPRGSAGAAVYWWTGDRPPTEVSQWHPAGNTTRPTMWFVLPQDAARPGTKLWITAAWLDRQLRPGTPGDAVVTGVGFEYVMAA